MTHEVAKVCGIPLRLHLSLLVPGLLFLLQFGVWGLPVMGLLFGSVLLHELGHALLAHRLGVSTSSIDLHMLGGTAMLRQGPTTSEDEAWIAAAGPAVSLSLASLFGALALLLGAELAPSITSVVDLILYGGLVNLGLGLFNLLPALPMDGGRILRAFLTSRVGLARGTRIAAVVSRVFGGFFIALALFSGSLTLGLIGLALFFLSAREEKLAQQIARSRGVSSDPHSPTFGFQVASPGTPHFEKILVVDPFMGRRTVRVRSSSWRLF